MKRWLFMMGLMGLIGVARAATAQDQVKSFASTLNSRINMPMMGGMDTLKAYDGSNAFEKLKAAGAYGVWFGAAAPEAVNGKRCFIDVVRDFSDMDMRFRAKTLGEEIERKTKYAQEKGQKGDTFWLLFIGLGLPEQTVPRAAVQSLIPLARFGNYGLFAVPGTSADVVAALSMLAQKASSSKLMEEVSVTTLSAQAGGAEELASLVANQPEYSAGGETSSAAVSTVGPQIKGYDPKQADRSSPVGPPPLKHIDTTGANFVKYGGWTTDSDREIERERKAREAKAAAAKKPRLTMADYAKQAEKDRAEFQVKKAQAAADNKQVLNWLLNDRNTKEADIRQRLQKRREYVDGQANRDDAVAHGKIFVEGGWVKIPLRNLTDVTMMVTVNFEAFDKNGERLGVRQHVTMLIALTSQDAILFAEEPGWRITDSRVSWVAERGQYQGNY